MRAVDCIVLGATLAFVVFYGLWRRRHSNNAEHYLLAGQTLPWYAMALSIMATQASAVTFISTTGQSYIDGMRFVQFYFGLPFAMAILSFTAVPLFHRARVFTAYEYLEQRFDTKTRVVVSTIFLIQRGLALGIGFICPCGRTHCDIWMARSSDDRDHGRYRSALHNERRATMSIRSILATVLAALAFSAEASAKTHHAGAKSYNVSDAALVKTLPGFNSSFATVNGIRLHYVAGGEGDPVFLLPGWPETWWSYHKIMPELAKRHRVISIDLRGMGSSDKPTGGYDKKSMA
jgi:hypothetical protein